jgi:hypothetical protein
MVAPLVGVELPGAGIANAVTTPGIAAAFAAPGMIRAARMTGKGNQAALTADAKLGGRNAADDFLSALDANPGIASAPGGYRKFMQDNGIDFNKADAYVKNKFQAPMGTWDKLKGVFNEDPNHVSTTKARNAIQGEFNKRAAVPASALGRAWGLGKSVVGNTFKWGVPAMATAGIGSALLGKPYDAESIKQEGYAAAQGKIQQGLDGMSKMERIAAWADPTLVASKLDQKMPGTIGAWEQRTGRKFQKGMLSSVMDSWKSGGTPSYYTTDAGGNFHYT